MYFKRLEMHGFKSFAEPVVIEFHEGVTCIVGPNGSGKSNISDAIRWVLGEQSPKALRGGKMEEVIFAGTASRKSRGMAEVTLVIDNSTGILDIDYNEVAITRRMYRSGESEYLINNNQCRLRDIRELIMDTGIGVDGYSLIGQGKIADIVSNKPDSRREIFEEAAGIVMYKSKKAEAERRLESTGGNLERVDDIIGEIEGRIGGLREDSAKAQEYLKLKDRYRDLEINITLKNIESIQSRNETYRNDISDLEKKIGEITASKGRTDRELEEDRQRSDALEKLGNEARDKLVKMIEEINRLTSESQINEERLSALEKDEERLKRESEELTEKLEKEKQNRAELIKTRDGVCSRHAEAQENLQARIDEHSRLSKEAADLSARMDSGREQLYQLHNLVSAKNSEVKSYESIIDTLERRRQQLLGEIADAKENTDDNDRQMETAEEEAHSVEEELKRAETEISRISREKGSLSEEKKTLSVRMEELKLQGSRKVSRKKTIEEMENNYEGYNYAVRYIMKANLPGIEGTVADKMSVPEEFSVAVETALGAQMQNIICDSDENAKRGVRLLKDNRAGRLTFLPVSSIRGKRADVDRQIAEDGAYRGLAAECIACDRRHQAIFDYLLGRVAVVDDMDAAVRLSKLVGSGIRFVTLEGEIINTAGAITGGRYKNKTANLLGRKNEIASLDEEIRAIREEVFNAGKKAEELAEKIETLERESEALEEKRREAQVASVALQSKIASLKEAEGRLRGSQEKASAEIASIEKESREARKTIDALREEESSARKKIEETSQQAESAMGSYEEKHAAVERAAEEITKARIAVNEWENKKSNAENLLKRIEETAEDYAFQIETKQRQRAELEEERNQILFGRDDSKEEVRQLLKEKEETESYIEAMSDERTALSEKIGKVTGQQREEAERLNGLQDQKYQLEIKSAKNDTQLDTLKERLWEDFEISYAQALDFKREDFSMAPSVKESREIRGRLRELGEVNVGAIKEYESVSRRYEFLSEQRKDIVTAMEELQAIISDMDTTIKTKFKENFDQVVENFEVIFKELFGGGHAELRMEDENNPLESGIDIIAQPPGKKLQNINLMSGGEKTMTAIALMFAVLKTKPTPFCILDEVEAALDDANIDRFAKYLRNFDGIQFALVTHQKATMEHADVLYGVTMPEQGVSKVLSLRLGDDFEL